MSQPGPPDPNAPQDPWSTSSDDRGEASGMSYPSQQYGQPPYGQPPYGQPPDGQPPFGPPYAQPGYGSQPPRINGKAQGAMWTGIGALVLSLCCFGVFGVVAIVLGVMARREIRASDGQQDGDGQALAGIITGSIAVVLSVAVIAFFVFTMISVGQGYEDTFSGDTSF